MGLFDQGAPTPIELRGTNTQIAPQYLTDYLTNLATTGQGLMNQGTIAGLPQNLQDLYSGAGETAGRYEAPMDLSMQTLQGAAQGVSAGDISQFYNPYEQDVVNEMSRQSGLNVQRNLLPQLKSAFAGSGGFGSQRYANATGQTLENVQSDLLGQQAKFRSEGYKSALDAAMKERGQDIQAGQSLYGLGQAEAQSGVNSLKALGDVGTQELAYGQSQIEAPLTRAQNIAQLLRGYQFPTTTEKVEESLGGTYSPSVIQQLGSLGTLFGAGMNAAGTGAFDRAGRYLGNQFEQIRYPAGNPLQTGEFASDEYWT